METFCARVLFEACPLCGGEGAVEVREADCTAHPLYRPELGSVVRWRGCRSCGHLYTEGWFDAERQQRLFARANAHQVAGANVETARHHAAAIVERVSTVRGEIGGRWLDVGFGDGALFTTAAEFGYEAVGIDVRGDSQQTLCAMGYDARQADFLDFEDDGPFDVVSMADVLEHLPRPAEGLARARDLLRPGGVLFVSMPNVDCYAWRHLDAIGQNPYWGELEHYHNFSREHLYWLLGREGFRPCHYAVGRRYRATMEVIAAREDQAGADAI